jgi:hypothetical protein
MEARQQREIRGQELARTYNKRFKFEDGFFLVPSETDLNRKYKVDVFDQRCDCHDFVVNHQKCKHLYAAEVCDGAAQLRPRTVPLRPTYSQKWPAYHTAQMNEKALFLQLLRELCKGIEQPEQFNGRPSLPIADQLFACAFKVYSTVSSRRFYTDLVDIQQKGFISETPHYNSLIRYFEKESLTPLLQRLIEESAKPLAALEMNFAVDASGLGTANGFTWFWAKFTNPKMIDLKDWLKIHCSVGTLTNVICAVEVTEKWAHDGKYFNELLDRTAKNFDVHRVTADKAYLSEKNLAHALDKGIDPYIAWKSDSKPGNKKDSAWYRLFQYYALNKEEFSIHYHLRSNVETAFYMLKTKFGGTLKSKTRVAQTNEALCKVLCHNLCCLIQSMHEFDVMPEFLNLEAE